MVVCVPAGSLLCGCPSDYVEAFAGTSASMTPPPPRVEAFAGTRDPNIIIGADNVSDQVLV